MESQTPLEIEVPKEPRRRRGGPRGRGLVRDRVVASRTAVRAAPDPLQPVRGLVPRVLVIEDNAEVQRQVRAALAGEGYRVELADDAVEGLGQVLRCPPDAVLLGAGLHGGAGLAVLATLREHERSAPVPVLAVAPPGDGAPPDRRLLRSLRCAGWLPRPVPAATLRRRLRSLLTQRTH